MIHDLTPLKKFGGFSMRLRFFNNTERRSSVCKRERWFGWRPHNSIVGPKFGTMNLGFETSNHRMMR